MLCFVEISENANSVDPDQTPRPAASDLGLHCLPVSLLWQNDYYWINAANVARYYRYSKSLDLKDTEMCNNPRAALAEY